MQVFVWTDVFIPLGRGTSGPHGKSTFSILRTCQTVPIVATEPTFPPLKCEGSGSDTSLEFVVFWMLATLCETLAHCGFDQLLLMMVDVFSHAC